MPKCLIVQVSKCIECPGGQCPLSTRVPKMLEWLECPSNVALVSKCPLSALQVPLECPSSALLVPFKCSLNSLLSSQSPFERPLSVLRVLLVSHECTLRKKGLQHYWKKDSLNSFIQFFKSVSEHIFYITLIFDYFLRNRMLNFNHFLQTIYNHSKGFQNISLNIL